MSLSLGVLAITFLVVLSVELPDKTLVATLVLSSRYRPLPVLAGVSAAFFVQCLIAVTAGQLLSLLPRQVVLVVVAILFAAGAVILFRAARSSPDHPGDAKQTAATSSPRIAATSFGVLFAAEWGDASQLATAALTARYAEPVSVFVGSFAALVVIATIAAVLGRVVLRVIPLVWVERAAALLFAALAGAAAIEAIRGD